MRVKISATTRLQGPGRLAEGAVVELDDETAQHLIDVGVGEKTTDEVTEDPAPEGMGSATVPDRPEDFRGEAEPAPEPEPEPAPEPEPVPTTGASARRTLTRAS